MKKDKDTERFLGPDAMTVLDIRRVRDGEVVAPPSSSSKPGFIARGLQAISRVSHLKDKDIER